VHVGLPKDLYIGPQLVLIYVLRTPSLETHFEQKQENRQILISILTSSSAHEHMAYLDRSAVLELGYLICVQAVNLFTSMD